MATETTTQRQAAGSKAAATRKRAATTRSSARTKASARQTGAAARGTADTARTTATQATETAQRGAKAAGFTAEALRREAERRFVLIPVGAALEARDAAVKAVRTYTRPETALIELRRFERRGERALKRR